MKYNILWNINNTIMYGPNQVWHVDGNDKLMNFGFALHGCINGLVLKCKYIYMQSPLYFKVFSKVVMAPNYPNKQ